MAWSMPDVLQITNEKYFTLSDRQSPGIGGSRDTGDRLHSRLETSGSLAVRYSNRDSNQPLRFKDIFLLTCRTEAVILIKR
jgi:hypothetical protein